MGRQAKERGSAEELITGFGALHFVLVFEVGGELGGGC